MIELGKSLSDFNKGYYCLKGNDTSVIRRVTSYISTRTRYITKIDNRRVKVLTKVRTNYGTPYEYTTYFLDDKEIIDYDNNTLKERHYWLNN